MLSYQNKTLFFLGLCLSFALNANAQTNNQNNSAAIFPSEILQISDHDKIKATVLTADKAKRVLKFYSPDKSLSEAEIFEIDIGKNNGNKTKRDDKKTPEGIYLLQKKMTPPEIPFDLYGSLAFTTDYPNVFDKFENKTGSGIWLHSVPDTVPLNRGSKGCVVLRNDVIQKISSAISLNKSYLIINDKTTMIDQKTHQEKSNQINQWIETWKTTWESQNLNQYINLYSDEFSAPGFNKQTWLKHKEKLKGIYKDIKIEMSKPSIFHIKNQYLVKFLQNYSSDTHKDTGIKTLYLIEHSKGLKIIREEWEAVN